MTLEERISLTSSKVAEAEAKLRQLAQMQDQLIAEHNKLIGKLEAYKELKKEAEETEAPVNETDVESD